MRGHLRHPQQHVRHLTCDPGEFLHLQIQSEPSVLPSLSSAPSPSTQLTIMVQNVPELSGGVTCVFEDLTETPGQVQARGQVVCMSPSLKDLPTHTPPYGETHTL